MPRHRLHHSYTAPSLCKSYRAALDVASDLGAALGIPSTDALHMISQLGQVIANRIRKGKISGIPGVGVIHVAHQKNYVRPRNLGSHARCREGNFYFSTAARVRLWLPAPFKKYIRDHAADAGDLDEQFAQLAVRKRQARRSLAHRRSQLIGSGRSEDQGKLSGPRAGQSLGSRFAAGGSDPSTLAARAAERLRELRKLKVPLKRKTA